MIPYIGPVVSGGAASALTRGSIVQPIAVTTPGLTLATPLAAVTLPPFGPVSAQPGSQIIVDWTETYQTFLGVGGAMTDSAAYCLTNYLTPAQATAFLTEMYGTNGCSTMRICMGSSDFTSGTSYFTYADNGGVADPSLTSFSIAMDERFVIPMILQCLAINPRLRIIATAWSPPVWLKSAANSVAVSLTNGTFNGTAANFATYAQYFVKFIQAYAAYGIPIWAVTPQNEPEYSQPGNSGAHYPGCGWAAADLATFIGTYLGPAFDAANITTKILAGDDFWSAPTYAQTCLASATALPYIEGTAWHGYGGTPLAQLVTNRPYPGRTAHLTEHLTQFADTAQTSLTNVVAVDLITAIRDGASSVTFWNTMLNQAGGPWELAVPGSSLFRGIVTVNASTGAITRNIEYYAFAHLGRYLLPGAKRCRSNTLGLGSTATDVMDLFFINPDGSVVGLLLNQASTSRTIPVTDSVTGQSFPMTLAPADIWTVRWAPGAGVAAGTLTPPSAPQNLTMTSSNGLVTWAWQAPASNGSTDLGGYVLNRGTASGAESAKALVVLPPGILTYTDTTATVGTTDFGTVSAYGGGGYSSPSAEASVLVVAGAPAQPTVALTPSSGQVSVAYSTTSNNGSAITQWQIYGGTTSGGETLLTTVSTSALSGTYAITGLTNGTPEYVYAKVTNSVGTTQSAENSAAPTNVPAHYLSGAGASGSAGYAAPTTAINVTDGFVECVCWVNLTSYTPSAGALLVGNYLATGGSTTNAQWGFGINTNGTPFVYISTAAKAFAGYAPATSATIASASPSASTGIYIRFVLNAGSAAQTDALGVSHASGTIQFYTSLDGSTWTALGAVITATAAGLNQPTAPAGYYAMGASGGVALAGKFYRATAYGSSGRVLLNPDFTAQATGTTSFADTAATSNTWTVYSPDTIT